MLLFNLKEFLSQWKPWDATVNFDTCWNLQQHRVVLVYFLMLQNKKNEDIKVFRV